MDEMPPTRVVVADPHGVIRRRIERLLAREEDLRVVAATGELPAAIGLAVERDADVLVLDLHMLGGSSRAAIRELRRRIPGAAIVILTMEAAQAFVPASIDAGASGYVLKEFAESDLAPAVRRAAAGERFISAKLAA